MPRKYKNRHRGKKKSTEINKVIKKKLSKYTNYVNKNSIFHKHVEKLELGVVILPQLFDGIECKIIESTCKMQGAHIINDRHDDLNFNHQVWRIEKTQNEWKEIYDKAISTMEAVDTVYWKQLQNANHVHPEVEFIKYQVQKNAPLPSIEPHVDNASVITMVAMLSDRSKNEYDGGISCFENYTQKEMSSVANPNNKNNIRRNNNNNINDIINNDDDNHNNELNKDDYGKREKNKIKFSIEELNMKSKKCREYKLNIGDAVFFRGELCEHWITPVSSGKRCILQIELCKYKNHH